MVSTLQTQAFKIVPDPMYLKNHLFRLNLMSHLFLNYLMFHLYPKNH